jgi:SanA protein
MSKKIILIFSFITLIILLVVVIPNILIPQITRGKTYNITKNIPHNRVGVLLGTSKYTTKGNYNKYYKYRILAAVELYKAGKIDFILISGDNGQKEYNEPVTIKKDLLKAGIPEDKIFLDYAGFRTWDSMIRAKKIFGQAKFTVISQKFHNERAIYIGKKNNINVIGFNAKDISSGKIKNRMRLREIFARTKLFIDILSNKQPKYLGDTIIIK